MIVSARLRPFASPRRRAVRLVWLTLLGLAFLALCLWNPVTSPGPVLCLLRRAVALPCPLCGCTRGVALCLRGHPVEATISNPLSVVAAVGGLALFALWTFEYVRGVAVEITWRRPWGFVLTLVAHAALLATWTYLLLYRREDDFPSSWLGRLL